MARYIDEKDVYRLVEPTGTAKVHCSQIDELPRADVVPKSEVIYDHHGQVACYTFGCTEADKVRKEAVVKTLSDINRQIHEKAIYPHNAGIKPYISVREVDEIIEKEISHVKGGG